MNCIVFGATQSAEKLLNLYKNEMNIIAFCDNDQKKWGQSNAFGGKKVIGPQQLADYDYDKIVIVSFSSMFAIKKQLINMGIDESKIDTSLLEYNIKARETFVKDFAYMLDERNIKGAVAEAGVFQGEFAKIINECFPDRFLYLFDTFEGFDKRDIKYEINQHYSQAKPGNLSITSTEIVMNKMKYPDNVIIKKGWFPESAIGIEEKFCFVNLDLDLYKPTIEGLRFFWPRMVNGGIILVHDYLSDGYEGVKAAIREFEKEVEIYPFPISDRWSIAIQRRF